MRPEPLPEADARVAGAIRHECDMVRRAVLADLEDLAAWLGDCPALRAVTTI